MTTGSAMAGKAVVPTLIVLTTVSGPGMLNSIRSGTPPTFGVALASTMACRCEPAPLSSVLRTAKVAGASRSSSTSNTGR
jgi:hypothetical protein